MDRNKLEQEALAYINKGNLDGALKAFTAMLKLDPKDRRVRQRVGELMLKMGRPIEAEKMLREVAEGLVREGQGRAAVAVYKQILTFKTDDPTLHYDLGDCYATSGYPNDSRQHFDSAARLYSAASKHIDAARSMKRIVDLQPGEVALKLKVAEYLEAGLDFKSALIVLREVMEDYRRRGRPDEVGRIAETALRLAPDDASLHLDVGAARLEAGEIARALPLLQGANQLRAEHPRTLALLARAYEELDDVANALASTRELARAQAAAGDVAGELEALRKASRLAPGDLELRARLNGVERRMHRLDRRLTQLQLGQATTEDELRVQVKAEVLARFGFFDRAIALLRNSPNSLPLLAMHAEILATSGDPDGAIRMIDAIAPKAGREREAVFDRIAVLKGMPEEEEVEDDATPIGAPLPGADLLDLDPAPEMDGIPEPLPAEPAAPVEAPLVRGDRFAATGDVAAALMAYRDALAEDPGSEQIIARIADLRNAARMVAPARSMVPVPARPTPELAPQASPDAVSSGVALRPASSLTPAPVKTRALPPVTLAPTFLTALPDDGVVGEIFPDEFADPFTEVDDPSEETAVMDSPAAEDAPAEGEAHSLEEAHSLVEVGLNDEALVMIGDDPRLEARVLVAKALRAKGNAAAALEALREATNEASEDDPAYAEALYELSGLYTASGKHRSALRLLEELADLSPEFRKKEVAARRSGLARLVK